MAEAAESQEFDVDATLAELEAPSPERAMTGEAEAPAVQEQAPVWDGKQWEFEWNGKKIVPESADKIKTWMGQGYNYSQRMGELNRTHAERMAAVENAQRQAHEYSQKFSPYSKVDDYARQNPQWWAHVQQAWQQQQQGQQLDPNLQRVLQPLQQELGEVKQFMTAQQQAQQQEVIQKEDQALDTEIDSIRKQHPNIDLNSIDPASGKSLETRVLQHAKAIGTGSFKAAFRDYLHDQLVEQAKASGREAIAKETQTNAKKGILGRTPAPVKGLAPATNVRGKSYDQLTKEALAELGIA